MWSCFFKGRNASVQRLAGEGKKSCVFATSDLADLNDGKRKYSMFGSLHHPVGI
jgi:hypothetical protein